MQPSARLVRAASSIALIAFGAEVSAQTTTLESANSQGFVSSWFTTAAQLSADGRYLVFVSGGTNLVANDTNGLQPDAFVRDRQDGSVELLSVTLFGGTPSVGVVPRIDASPDARFAVFESSSTELVANDNNIAIDVFLRDRQNGSTEFVALSSTGVHSNASSFDARVSDDGRVVAFASQATNLVSGDTNARIDIYVRDRIAGTTQRLSLSNAGTQSIHHATSPVISGDGLFVAFAGGDDLVAGAGNGAIDVLVRDLAAGTTELANVSTGGVGGNAGSFPGGLSQDGSLLAFTSSASNLVGGDGNAVADVFVRDLATGTTEIVSVSSLGALGNGVCDASAISDDGRWVVFESLSTNLVSGDTNGRLDIFLRDRQSGTTTRASLGPAGEQATENCDLGGIDAQGRNIAFWTLANLAPADINAHEDAYVRDLGYTGVAPVTYCTAKASSAGCTPKISAMGQPLASGFDSFFVLGRILLPNKNGLLFWGHSAASLPFGGGTLCVQLPLVRTPIQGSGVGSGCTGAFSFHFSQAYMASENVGAGDTIYGQYWFRDPGFAAPNNVGLSDGIQFTVAP